MHDPTPPVDARGRPRLALVVAGGLDAAAAGALTEELRESFDVMGSARQAPRATGAPGVEVTLMLAAVEQLGRPALANLLSRPLYRALDRLLPRPVVGEPIEFRFRFAAPTGDHECVV